MTAATKMAPVVRLDRAQYRKQVLMNVTLLGQRVDDSQLADVVNQIELMWGEDLSVKSCAQYVVNFMRWRKEEGAQ